MKKVCCFLVVLVMILTSGFAAFASAGDDGNEYTIEQSVVADIQNYYESFLPAIIGNRSTVTGMIVSDAVAVENEDRIAAFARMEENIGVNFVNVEVDVSVGNILQEGDNVIAEVCEWFTIEYQYPGFEETDIMGFEVKHQVVLEERENGFAVIGDYYDDIVTGACTEEVSLLDEENRLELPTMNVAALENGSRAYTLGNYSASQAIAYANTWANSVNPVYGEPSNGNDCANYVSQCLHEGGVAEINGSGGWYCSGAGYYSDAWARVSTFDSFWSSKVGGRANATRLTILPGNPIYWLNADTSSASGHLMFCVGYDSSGTPVYNAHNPKQYQVPYTQAGNPSTLYTLYFVSRCGSHNNSVYNNATYHWHVCSTCGYRSPNATHTYSNGVCTTCHHSTTARQQITMEEN